MCVRFTGVEEKREICPAAGNDRAGPRGPWPARSQKHYAVIVRGLCYRDACGPAGVAREQRQELVLDWPPAAVHEALPCLWAAEPDWLATAGLLAVRGQSGE